jgi:hypothetical protein
MEEIYEIVEESTERSKNLFHEWKRKLIEELIWIEIIVDEFYFPILFYL